MSYNDKHNEKNLEDNRDGANDNASWNCGVEGPTDDPEIIKLRERQKRNLLATLFLSQGVSMMLAGDELSQTQNGTNNAYCQDNETTWLSWDLDEEQQRFLEFVQRLARIWREQPVFQRSTFFQGRAIRGSDITDISWFNPSGQQMTDADWSAGYVQSLGMRLAGDLIGDVTDRGEPIEGDTIFLILNAWHEGIDFMLPETKPEHHWERLFDTALDGTEVEKSDPLGESNLYKLQQRSVALFVTRRPEETGQAVSEAQLEAIRREPATAGRIVPPIPPAAQVK